MVDEDSVVDVKASKPYILEVTFAGGFRGRINVEPQLWGELFEPLRDPKMFMQARFDPDFGTVVWPNGADLSPEFIAETALATPA